LCSRTTNVEHLHQSRALRKGETISKQFLITEGLKQLLLPAEELRISRDDRMGAKIKTKKTPWTKNQPPKIPLPNFRALKIPKKD